jgi:acetyltransferase-like isoleucine patch superfamily enzyme
MQLAKAIVRRHAVLMRIYERLFRYREGFALLFILWVGYIPSHRLRLLIYRLLGLHVGKKSVIYGRAELRSPRGISIGNHTVIGHCAILDGRGELVIGDNVNVSTGVWIWTVQHNKDDPYFSGVKGRVIIEDYAWISCRTTILPGITVGKGAVVCAGAVVTKDVRPYEVVAGVPARKIGDRPKDLRYQLGDDYIDFV